MKRFDGRPTHSAPEPGWERLPLPPHLKAWRDKLFDWLNEKMYKPNGMTCPGVSLVDFWHYGSYVGIDDEVQDDMLDYWMDDLDHGLRLHRARQLARARGVKYTSSGHARWWERAREALDTRV